MTCNILDDELPIWEREQAGHDCRMAEISREVRDHYEKFRAKSKEEAYNIGDMKPLYEAPGDIACLDRIIQITGHTAKVEANVTMASLVDATLRFGLLPTVVASQKTMTVSEAFANITIETSSFEFGTFDCTVLEIEVVTSNGNLVKARPRHDGNDGSGNHNDSLFYGSAGTMNSLGLTTMFEISLTLRGPYVELEFLAFAPSASNMRKEVEVPSENLTFSPQETSKELLLSLMAKQKTRRALAEIDQQASTLVRTLSKLHQPTSLYDMAIEKMQKSSYLVDIPINDMKTAIAGVHEQLLQSRKLEKEAFTDSPTDPSLVSTVMAHMLWASSDSSVEFVEAMVFEDCSGVIVGRTCATCPVRPLESKASESFTEITESFLKESRTKNKSQVRYMETKSYLFRNSIVSRPSEKLNKHFRRKCKEELKLVKEPIFQIGVCPDAIEGLLEEFQPVWKSWPLRICPVLSPRRLGRQPSHGIGSTFDLSKDVYLALGSRHIIESGEFDKRLKNGDPNCEKRGGRPHSTGFRFLHCHLRGPLLVPWSAHDDKGHSNLRKKWLADGIPDVEEQLSRLFQYTPPLAIAPQCRDTALPTKLTPAKEFLGKFHSGRPKRHSTSY